MVDYGLLSRVINLLGKATYVFRPATLKLCEERVAVTISGNAVTIRRDATFDRGWILRFANAGRFDIPLPLGLTFGTEVTCRSPGIEVDFHGVGPLSITCDLRKLLQGSAIMWKRGQNVHLEVVSSCDTEQFLEFPMGAEGEPSIEGDFSLRTIIIRKNRVFRDVVIRNYRWRRSIPSAVPVTRITLAKNGEAHPDLQIDRIRTQSRSIPAAVAAAEFRDDPLGEPARPNEIRTDTQEVTIPLSFDAPDDEYKIVLFSEQE